MYNFELLAPAGSFDILKAVEAAGADAVYVGGNVFGARAYANNFTQEELLEAIDYLHLRGKRLFLTVNTLMKNQEIENQLYDFLLPLYNHGLDAVIVQDLGAVMFIHNAFPDMEIHTSTQMTVTGVDGARFLMQYGVTRVVMAREMSLKEMQLIHDETGIELEAFVHGALCYCYSGQCLFSSMLGGRSGNRGRCAQPCRLMYSVLDQCKKILKKDTYILSLKDLCGIEDLPNLASAGVYSLKIEGRMKQADYAAGVVSMYRKYIDYMNSEPSEFVVSKDDKKLLLDLGNRCGFTNDYFYKQNDASMVTYVKPSYEKRETSILDQLRYNKIRINGELTLMLDQETEFEVEINGVKVKMCGQPPMLATNRPLLATDVEERMRKTGDTPFEFDKLTIHMDDNIFIPNGQLNQLRRDALEELLSQYMLTYRRNNANVQIFCDKKPKVTDKLNSALVSTREQLQVVINSAGIDLIYLDSFLYQKSNYISLLKKDIKDIHDTGKKAGLALPNIFRDRTLLFYKNMVNELMECEIDCFLARNYEQLYWLRTEFPNVNIVADHNLYAYNDYANQTLLEHGVDITTIPLELNKQEILNRNNFQSEMIVYGYYPLMVSAGCVHKNSIGCDHKPTITYIRDRYNIDFPIRNCCEDCYNIIYNSLPTLLIGKMDEVAKSGIRRFRLQFTLENAKETKEILKLFEAKSEVQGFTNGHYKRGVE